MIGQRPVAVIRVSAFFLLLLFTLALGAQDHDVPVSNDGLRCDTCGTECSMHCGSRNFRACCFNYIKKRSIPWTNPPEGSIQEASANSENVDQQDGVKSASDAKSPNAGPAKPSVLLKHQGLIGGTGGRHIYQRYVPEVILGTDSLEDPAELYPLTLKDLVASMARILNVYEDKRFGRGLLF